MNKLSFEKRVRIVSALVEGCSIASTCRMTGAAKMTVLSLLADMGEACADLHNRWVRDLPAKLVQVDEIWSFVGMKAKNVPVTLAGTFGYGDVWTFTAIDAETKLIAAWRVGIRDQENTNAFISDLASRIRHTVQISSDAYTTYPAAIQAAWVRKRVDYGQLVKYYGDGAKDEQKRYSPARFKGAERKPIFGDPDEKSISTSYVERQNLNIRMENRRMTRLTNAFSKKVENHTHQLAINFAYHNFVRVHRTLRCTPAMAAGIVSELWTIADQQRCCQGIPKVPPAINNLATNQPVEICEHHPKQAELPQPLRQEAKYPLEIERTLLDFSGDC